MSRARNGETLAAFLVTDDPLSVRAPILYAHRAKGCFLRLNGQTLQQIKRMSADAAAMPSAALLFLGIPVVVNTAAPAQTVEVVAYCAPRVDA